MRGFARLGSTLSVGGNLCVGQKIMIGNPYNSIEYVNGNEPGNASSPPINKVAYIFYAQSAQYTATGTAPTKERAISIVYDNVDSGGERHQFHGYWHFEHGPTTGSDRRLKKNIRGLYDQLSDVYKQWKGPSARLEENVTASGLSGQPKSSSVAPERVDQHAAAHNVTTHPNPVSEIFRALRPVSYIMKKQQEAKNPITNFGFIAQELEEVLPSLVRTDPRGMKSVAYNDMIAIITLTVQQEMVRLDLFEKRLTVVEGVAEEHDVILESSEEKIKSLEKELQKIRKEREERARRVKEELDAELAASVQHNLADQDSDNLDDATMKSLEEHGNYDGTPSSKHQDSRRDEKDKNADAIYF
jgi:hypothetical protein